MSEQASTTLQPDVKPTTKHAPMWNVVLLDDDDHTYDYVIEMLMDLFAHSAELAYQMAVEVDETGRVIVETTVLERAEFKREQIVHYGADWRLERSAGSMRAVLEAVT